MADTPPTPAQPTPKVEAKTPPPTPQISGDVMPEGGAALVHITFWHQPWVQNILPFATSLVLHIGIIVSGFTAFKVTQVVYNKVVQEQVIIPDATLAENGPPGGIVNPGTGGDASRRAEQNIDDTVSQSEGWATKKGEALQASLSGGGAGENDSDNTIGAGMNSAFGRAGPLRHPGRRWRHRAESPVRRRGRQRPQNRLPLRRFGNHAVGLLVAPR